MAKKTKIELLEDAEDLGLELDEDQSYSDILAAVRAAQEEEEDAVEQVEAMPVAPEPVPEPEPTTAQQSSAEVVARWPYNELGVFVGRSGRR